MMRLMVFALAFLAIPATAFAVDPLVNGNFQGGNTGWTFVTIDTGYGLGTAEINIDPLTTRMAAHAYAGPIQGRALVIQQLTSLVVGETLTFSGKGSAWAQTTKVGFFRNDVSGTVVDATDCPGEGGVYLNFSVSHTVDASDITSGLYVGIHAGLNGGAEGYIDDVILTSTPGPFPTPTSVGHWSLYR